SRHTGSYGMSRGRGDVYQRRLYGWFGPPQLGVAGVAISTVAGRIVGVVLLGWLVARQTGIRLRLPAVVPVSYKKLTLP
ncbi:hypothetical protein ACQ4LF_24935, partial [Aeromonas salmonicida]